jgi:hypothetical protein
LAQQWTRLTTPPVMAREEAALDRPSAGVVWGHKAANRSGSTILPF